MITISNIYRLYSFFTGIILVILTSQISGQTLFSAEDACNITEGFNENHFDLIVLMDASCPITEKQCKQQQLETAETVMSIRGDDTVIIDSNIYSAVRVSYTEFNSNDDINLIIGGFHDPINMNVIDPAESRVELYTTIKNSSICDENNLSPTIRTGEPNLQLAITRALDDIDNFLPNTRRVRKMLIVSNCEINDEQKQKICEEHGKTNSFGINVVMINNVFISDRFINPSQYIMCLVEYDERRIKVNQPDTTNYIEDIIPSIQNEICEMPTPAPTTNPTQFGDTISPTSQTGTPTSKPTKFPTVGPTVDPTTDPSIDPTTAPITSKYPSESPTSNAYEPTENPSNDVTDTETPIQNTIPLIVDPVIDPKATWLWLWVLIGILSCCCCGFIVFVILRRKKQKEEKRGYGYVAGHPSVDHQVSRSESDVVNNDELEHLAVVS